MSNIILKKLIVILTAYFLLSTTALHMTPKQPIFCMLFFLRIPYEVSLRFFLYNKNSSQTKL